MELRPIQEERDLDIYEPTPIVPPNIPSTV